MSDAAELRAIFESAGAYQPFDCAYCAERDNFVSGPHSHECSVCGGHATYGWYTEPRCAGHFHAEHNKTE